MRQAAKQPTGQRDLGRYAVTSVGGESVRAYLPPKLPPNPPVQLAGMLKLLGEADVALGRLDSVSALLPNPQLFLYTYIRKEAVLSSQIEGTQSTLVDLMLFESEGAPDAPRFDVAEVSNYVGSLNHGLERLNGGFPLSLRLLREMHSILLQDGRGADLDPGEFRRSQNWIVGTRPGNAHYVPPPPERLMECLGAFEKFLHAEDDLPVLVKAALAHVQFESIHPFLDGNGRLGRLLVTLLLCVSKTLQEPTLYLSLYLKKHRQRYYDLLTRVRETGDWETWVRFFLEGVRETAIQAADTAHRILRLLEADRARLETIGRASATALRMHQYLHARPAFNVTALARELGLSFPTVAAAASRMEALGILHEATGRSRGKVYFYTAYMDILNEGTEPLPRG
jgi:Fic family protein